MVVASPLMYPSSSPLLLGHPDGIIRPAVMVAFAFGARVGTRVWVTGDQVDSVIGTLVALLEGEVTIVEADPGFPTQRTAAVDVITAKGEPEPAAAVAPVGADRPETAGSVMTDAVLVPMQHPEPSTPQSAAGVAGSGHSEAELDAMSYQEVRAVAADLDVLPGGQGRPSKLSLIAVIRAAEASRHATLDAAEPGFEVAQMACCGGRRESVSRLDSSGQIRPVTGPMAYLVEGGTLAATERYDNDATSKAAGFRNSVDQARARAHEVGGRVRSIRA